MNIGKMKPNYMYVNDHNLIKQLANMFNSENGLYHGNKAIVALLSGKPVGILSLSNNWKEIVSLEVNPKYRRRGIATQLIYFAKKLARQHGRKKLSVVSMNMRSNALYSRHGKKRQKSSTFNIMI